MDAIGLKIVFKKDSCPSCARWRAQGKIPMRGDGWNADYPDAEKFMQLLYGPNVGPGQPSRFNLPEFNKLYEEARAPARFAGAHEAVRPDDRAGPRLRAVARDDQHLEDTFAHPWVRYYVPHPIRSQGWTYIDVDQAARAKRVSDAHFWIRLRCHAIESLLSGNASGWSGSQAVDDRETATGQQRSYSEVTDSGRCLGAIDSQADAFGQLQIKCVRPISRLIHLASTGARRCHRRIRSGSVGSSCQLRGGGSAAHW